EESYKLGRQKPGPVRIVIARAKYKIFDTEANSDPTPDSDSEGNKVTIKTAPLPRSLLRRSILAPSMLAYIIVCKFCYGIPYYRQEKMLAADGIDLDRGSMARSVEDVGASLGEVVLACAEHAKKNAFCLSTDATGILNSTRALAGRGATAVSERAFLCSTGRQGSWAKQTLTAPSSGCSARANLLSLIASAKLHDIDPEQYLAELIHVMPYWPRERYLELASFRWKQTRARLDSAELRRGVGPVTVPPPFSDSAEQAPPS